MTYTNRYVQVRQFSVRLSFSLQCQLRGVNITDYSIKHVINPRRACSRLVCVCVCMYVCVYVCLSTHAILAVRAIKSVTKDTVMLNVRFAAIL